MIAFAFGVALSIAVTLGVTRSQLPWNDKFFVANALWYEGAQICCLLALLPFRPPAPTLAGVSILIATYLILFDTWVLTWPSGDGSPWLIYFIAVAAATFGAVRSIQWLRMHPRMKALQVGIVSATFSLVGIVIVHSFFFVIWLLGKIH